MIKKTLILVLVTLALCLGAAAAEENGILGRPFPNFTVTDTQGNTFALSEKLQDHEAVLINIWATWCRPCESEMGSLNEAYHQYGDRVAFIALSTGPNDTAETIEAYRQAHGLDFPMGRDEGASLFRYTGGTGIPATVIVDRFGNAAFLRVGAFWGTWQVSRLIESFLGEGYTETAVLTEIPADSSTRALPVSAATGIQVENEGARPVLFRVEGRSEPLQACVINDDTARLVLKAAASDHPESMICYDYRILSYRELQDLADPENGVYVYDSPMPGAQENKHYTVIMLADREGNILKQLYLIAGDEYVEELAEDLRGSGYQVSWEYAGSEPEKDAAPNAYTLHFIDQNGSPVPGVFVNFCTDTACSMQISDETGTVSFGGTPDAYHVQLLQAPEGFSFDPDFEMYTDAVYGEWVLRIRKDG